MIQKVDILQEVCAALLNGRLKDGIDILSAKYPFENYTMSKRKAPRSLQAKIFLRDGFIDRYTGAKLLCPPIFRIISKLLPDAFPFHTNWKMTETHIAYWDLFPTIDHKVPIARKGFDTEENMITTSMLKNAAKANFTLDELGWVIKEPGSLQEWDGMIGTFRQFIDNDPLLLTDTYISSWKNAFDRNI